MDLRLQGRRVLVTGSTSGIGEAIARALAREGASVVVQGRREAEAARVSGEIRNAGGKAAVALGDLGDDAAAARVASAARKAFGGIDVLVNNAGAFPERSWWEGTPAEWSDLFNQNVVSMVRLVRELVPDMKKAGWGRVVNIASGVGTMPMPNMPAYSVTKGANLNLTVSLARDLAGTGVTVNSVSPGPVVTAGFEEFGRKLAKANGWGDDWADIERNLLRMIPVPAGRLGRPEDIAAMVAFLSSPSADWVNGANLRVDGGAVPTVN